MDFFMTQPKQNANFAIYAKMSPVLRKVFNGYGTAAMIFPRTKKRNCADAEVMEYIMKVQSQQKRSNRVGFEVCASGTITFSIW
jgi:hypothetical protein